MCSELNLKLAVDGKVKLATFVDLIDGINAS